VDIDDELVSRIRELIRRTESRTRCGPLFPDDEGIVEKLRRERRFKEWWPDRRMKLTRDNLFRLFACIFKVQGGSLLRLYFGDPGTRQACLEAVLADPWITERGPMTADRVLAIIETVEETERRVSRERSLKESGEPWLKISHLTYLGRYEEVLALCCSMSPEERVSHAMTLALKMHAETMLGRFADAIRTEEEIRRAPSDRRLCDPLPSDMIRARLGAGRLDEALMFMDWMMTRIELTRFSGIFGGALYAEELLIFSDLLRSAVSALGDGRTDEGLRLPPCPMSAEGEREARISDMVRRLKREVKIFLRWYPPY